jgi:hypothetical protein
MTSDWPMLLGAEKFDLSRPSADNSAPKSDIWTWFMKIAAHIWFAIKMSFDPSILVGFLLEQRCAP